MPWDRPRFAVDDPSDAHVDDELGAGEARRVGATQGTPSEALPVVGGLDDSALLGADAPAGDRGGTASPAGVVAAVPAVLEPGGRFAVAGGHHRAVADDHPAAGPGGADGPAGGETCGPEEVGDPIRRPRHAVSVWHKGHSASNGTI
jgi:hypothetical protein